jgi:hypothetical protein
MWKGCPLIPFPYVLFSLSKNDYPCVFIFVSIMLSDKCAILIQAINIITLLSGLITAIVGASMIPQNLNNGNIYIGTGEQYEAELRAAQLASYGFKLTIIGLIGIGYAILGCGCIYGCRAINCRSNSVNISPQPPREPQVEVVQLAQVVQVAPLKSILKDTRDRDLQLNIRKWTGGVTPDIV